MARIEKTLDRKRVIVVGGGASGMMAAGTAAKRGLDTVLVEKNNRLGRKLLITGKGRCNITNATDVEGLIQNTPGNGSFLYSTFYSFSNWDIIDFFEKYGVKTKIERGNRVFPASDKSSAVIDALKRYVEENHVKIMYNSEVEDLVVEGDKANGRRVCGVILKDGRKLEADSVILATGGASYRATGSTGDGYRIAAKWGHTVRELKPSLIPLLTRENWVKDLQGLSLRNVSVTFRNRKKKVIYQDFGEMLFTHFGVSGPVILSASRHLLDYDYRDVTLSIDLKPALDEQKLDERIQRDFTKYSRKMFKNSLDDLLPMKMIPVMVMLSGINPEKPVNQITHSERRNLVQLFKNLELEIVGCRPINEAIVTVGGVSTDEINPGTMESRLIEGLFFAGEVIDVDGYTGGFNLTIAFSTGHTAGSNC